MHRVARIPPKFYPHRRWRRQKSWLLENIWTPWATHHFQKTLGILKPEVVWVIPHGWSIPPVAAALPQSGIGFHVSIHDYPDVRGHVMRFGADRSYRLGTMVDQLYSSAATRDAISQPMADDLRARTGRDGTITRAGLEEEDFHYLSGKTDSHADSIRIAYAGTILAEKEFAIFAQVLARIRQQLPAPLWLDFFGDHSYRSGDWFDPAWMRECGHLPAPQLSEALKKCTWGFSPMELTDENPRYNRFSFPTKFISYLAAGLPVIALGHPECSVVKMAQTYRVGPCIASSDPECLGQVLLKALSEPNLWSKYGQEILRCSQTEFDASRMRRVLYGCFGQCAGQSRRGADSP